MNELKIGDIIVVNEFSSKGIKVGRHSFVVIEDQSGEICGLNYDFVSLLMSSFKNDEQKKQKLKYPGNFPILVNSEDVKDGHNREGFIKAEQFYYFNKDKTKYFIIGELKAETLQSLLDFIESLKERGISIDQIIDNL